MDRIQPNAQKIYRENQKERGLVRYEIQVSAKSKEKFEEVVNAVSEEYVKPYDKRKRLAKARAQVFDDLTNDITHEFFELKDRLKKQAETIKALSPTFKTNDIGELIVPDTVKKLPDDPEKLKLLITKLYTETNTLKTELENVKRVSEQYRALYETVSNENERIKTSN